MDGKICPETEFSPHTLEGMEALKLLGFSGVWQRSGMDGVIAGLDWSAVQGIIQQKAETLDASVFEALASDVESGFLSGLRERETKD